MFAEHSGNPIRVICLDNRVRQANRLANVFSNVFTESNLLFLQLESDTGSSVAVNVKQILQIRPSRDDRLLTVIHIPGSSITVKMPFSDLMATLDDFKPTTFGD